MKKLIHWLDEYLEVSLCVALMSVMTVVIFVQVVMRYVFHNSLTWSEEFAKILLYLADLSWDQLWMQDYEAHQN